MKNVTFAGAVAVGTLLLVVGCAGAAEDDPVLVQEESSNIDTNVVKVADLPPITIGSSGAGAAPCMAKTECTKRDLYGTCTCSKQTICTATGSSTFSNGSGCTLGSGLVRGF